ncbi:MAG: beta-galactosidase [Oligoflexus sp.]
MRYFILWSMCFILQLLQMPLATGTNNASFITADLTPGQKKLQRSEPYTLELSPQGIKIDGRYTLLRGGSLQWFRLPPEVWEDRMQRFAAMGFNTIDMYIAWNQIEPREGEFNFSSPDIRHFLELARKYGLYVIVRPGPYITNEMDGGGLPAWLTRYSTKSAYEADGLANLRTHDPDFIEPVRRYLHALNEVLKPYTAPHGGPIVLYTIENEYNWFERSFQLDRLFKYKGKLERPLFDPLPTAPYFTALRDIVLESGIEVPIIACPGDGKISAMGDVEGVIPFPNIYEWANPGQPEEIAYDLLQNMRDPQKHGGIYQQFPSGSLELNRSAQELRRLVMGGLDAFMIFNLVGMIQENYLNSLTLAARAGDQAPHWGPPNEPVPDWFGTIFDFSSFDRIVSGFVSPDYGYFGNVIDYKGAVSSSGVLRDLFYLFRRDNQFYQAVEPVLAGMGMPQRSGTFEGAHTDLQIHHPDLGARQGIGNVHYWLSNEEGSSFVSLLNQTGKSLELFPGQINFRGQVLPKYQPISIPPSDEVKLSYAHIMPFQINLAQDWQLNYTTSELLTFRPFNDETLLVVYGSEGSWGEMQLAGKGLQHIFADEDFTVHEQNEQSLVISYPHRHGASILIRDENGNKLRLIVTTRAQAGHFWFLQYEEQDLVVSGVDFIDQIRMEDDQISFVYDYDERKRPLLFVSPVALKVTGHKVIQSYQPMTQMLWLQRPQDIEKPHLPDLTDEVWLRSDLEEADPDFDDSDWIEWQGEPQALEYLDILQGRAWYRTEFEIADLNRYKGKGHLYIENASDIIGIYINGHYLTTVAPVGTEINNRSIDQRYRFASLRPFLRTGKNVIAFRTEVWGHGSFMFGRGRVIGTKARLSSIAYDGLKGLYGKAHMDQIKLEKWKVRSELTGERQNFSTELDESWQAHSGLPKLNKGEVLWYRKQFPTSQLPSPEYLHAPLVLNLQGQRSKATIHLNGRMLGRWLSDADWLSQGSWASPQRGMWVPLNADHFPLPRELMRAQGMVNDLVIVFEDTSHSDAPAGQIEKVELIYNQENLRWNGSKEVFLEGVRARKKLEVDFLKNTK